MPQLSPFPTDRIPRWLTWLLSGWIAFHLLAVVVNALAASSGPWPTGDGIREIMPPRFAYSLNNAIAPKYNQFLRMTHTYHFVSNRPGLPGVYLEFHLKDAAGNSLGTRKLPEDDANFQVWHRQDLLARDLGDDVPVPPPQGEAIPAPNQQVPMVQIWDMDKSEHKLNLKMVPQHLVPRDRPILQPSERSMRLAQSYGRYLCRTYGAASVEILRHHRDPIPPMVLSTPNVPAGEFDEIISNFGEFSR